MILLSLDAFRIPDDALRVSNAQLGGDIRNNSNRDVDRVNEKGSQESERSHLNPEAQAVMVSTALGNEGTVLIIQVKIPRQLLKRWFANIATIPLLLFLGKILNRHSLFFLFFMITLL